MSSVAIPNWTTSGVLPPINPATPTTVDRSPYKIAITDLILHFNISFQRYTILAGFLDFRQALHNLRLVQGFQWLNGSFLEDIESTENRTPRDVDVVTFFHLPIGQTQASLLKQNPPLFDPRETKSTHHVDAYFVQLDTGCPEPLVALSTYWYSMWSHRRSGEWKGYLQVDLSSDDDQAVRANLINSLGQGGQP
jgi:Family of unknown function (DUF6932)